MINLKKWCIMIASLLLVIVMVYIVSDFYSMSDQLYEDYANTSNGNNYSREDFYTEYLDTVAENITEPADSSPLDNSVIGAAPIGSIDMSAWYSDIPANTVTGSKTREIFVQSTDGSDKTKFPDIYIYDGLPWPPDSNTYFFNLRKAREDVWPLYELAGIKQKSGSGMLLSSNVPHSKAPKEVPYDGAYAVILDNIAALGCGVWPTMWKNYYSDYALVKGTMDSVSGLWQYKMAIVVVNKGEDVNDKTKWKYVPATRDSAKAHTFYGGVLQTNVKLTDAGDIIPTSSSSGMSGNSFAGNTKNYGNDEASVVQMLKDVQAVHKYNMGDWWTHYIETYNVGAANMNRVCADYDFVGYVIYGDTFLNMK